LIAAARSARGIDIFAAVLTARPAQSNHSVMAPRLLVAAAFLAAAVAPALADDVPLPELTPKGQYLVMTQDDATSTSKCIGDPKTPMCAVETLLACYQRNEPDLCEIATGTKLDPEYRRAAFGSAKPEPQLSYLVVRREILTDRRFPWQPGHLEDRPNEIGMRAGDIRIDILDVTPGRESDPGYTDISPRVAYIVRRYGDRWAAIDWRPPYKPVYLGPSGFDP
jgi:hypothetical protein